MSTPDFMLQAAVEIADLKTALARRGYQEIAAWKRLRAGARVYHIGQQWPGVYTHGTATVAVVMQRHGRIDPDIEVIVVKDRIAESIILGQWANYHCCIADQQPTSSTEDTR